MINVEKCIRVVVIQYTANTLPLLSGNDEDLEMSRDAGATGLQMR